MKNEEIVMTVKELVNTYLTTKDSEKFLMDVKEKYGADADILLYAVEKVILHALAAESENMMNKCYSCKHCQKLPGTHHITCTCEHAGVVGDEHGIKNGWFFHPFNFDPVWLQFCTAYEEKIK